MKLVITSLLMVCVFTQAQADTQITVRDKSGSTSTFSSNGKSARMDDNQRPGYVLINFDKNQFNMIDPERREIMEMSTMPGNKSKVKTENVTVRLINKGSGPLIAGYKTRKYLIQANGKNCGTVYGSRKVLALKGIEDIFNALSQLQRQSQTMAGAFRGSRDDCEQADLQMSDSIKTTGAPLRMLDQHGQLENEVTSINTRASHPAAFYQPPAGYRVTNMQQQMDQTRQQNQQMMQQMQQNMPDMNKLMQQMQQQQGMPPEAMERMKKMQEMFQQQMPPQ